MTIVIAAGALATAPGALDYEPATLERMIGQADAIVHGRVERDESDVVWVAVLAAQPREAFGPGLLEVVKPLDWDDRPRARRYIPGHEFIWILRLRAEAGVVGATPRWQVSGFEGEGELAVAGNDVYLKADLVPVLPSTEAQVQGQRGRFQRIARSLLWDAARWYRRCYRWAAPAEGDRRARPRGICARSEIDEFRRRSALHEYLAARAE